MKKLSTIILLLLFSIILKADLNNAHNIYTNNFKDAKQGLYIKDNIAFVIVIIKDKLRKNLYEATGMLRSKALIDQYINKSKTRSPRVKLVNSEYISNIIDNNKKSLSYNISRTRVLKNGMHKDGYYYVVAISKNELDAIKKKNSLTVNDIKSSIDILKKVKKSFINSEENKKIKKIYLEIGSIESALSYDNSDGVGYEYNLETYVNVRDYIKFLKNIKKAYKWIETRGIEAPQQISKVLSLCPGNYQALSALKKDLKSQNKPLSLLLISFVLKFYSSPIEMDMADFKEITSNHASIKEYSKLISVLDNFTKSDPNKSGNVLKYIHTTLGHVNFSSNCNNKSNEPLEKAKELFNAGTNLPQIINNLYTASQLSPRNIEVWSYLGAAMLADEQYKSSVIYLNQALFMDNSNSSVKVNLAKAYSALNFMNLAKGMALDALTDESNLSEYEIKICKKIINIQ